LTGRQDGVAAYLDAMTRLIAAHAAEGRINPGADQGLHNYIAHHGLIEAASFLDNYRRVATLHHVDGADLRPGEAGRVVNPDGSVSEIAHQWDRHPDLAAAIAASGAERRRATSDQLRRKGRSWAIGSGAWPIPIRGAAGCGALFRQAGTSWTPSPHRAGWQWSASTPRSSRCDPAWRSNNESWAN